MIPDYLVEEYREIQHENGRTELTWEQAEEELSQLTDLLLTLTQFKQERSEDFLDD